MTTGRPRLVSMRGEISVQLDGEAIASFRAEDIAFVLIDKDEIVMTLNGKKFATWRLEDYAK